MKSYNYGIRKHVIKWNFWFEICFRFIGKTQWNKYILKQNLIMANDYLMERRNILLHEFSGLKYVYLFYGSKIFLTNIYV